jgi:Tfp pilus assembly protein PilF
MKIYARTLTRLGDFATPWNRLVSIGGFQNARPALGEIARLAQPRDAFSSFLEKQRSGQSPQVFLSVLLPIAEEGKLADLEARWRYEAMMMEPGSPASSMQESRLIRLQMARMRFDELGLQLEAYWNVHPNNEQKPAILARAAEAYRAGGNTPAEMRALASGNSQRYLRLLAQNRPDELIRLSAQQKWHEPVNEALRSGNGDLARRAVESQGRANLPVWGRAYTALAGLYYMLRTPDVATAWNSLLGSQVIGDRLGKPVDRNQQLAGGTWFYYGSRYGEYLAAAQQAGAEDYLSAMLELAPGNADGYWQLGEYYREAGDVARAMSEYDYALQLDPMRGEAYDREAVLLWQQGKRDEAVQRWKQCFAAFARMESERRLPARFWSDVRLALENVGRRSLFDQVKPEADSLLRSYIRRNGSYRVEPLLMGALAAAGDAKAGTAWIADLSRSAVDPASFLGGVARARWIPDASREPPYQALLSAARAKVAEARGEEKQWRQSELRNWQIQWIGWLVEARQADRARQALDELPAETRPAVLEIRIAALQKTLDPLLASYRSGSKEAPTSDILRNAAAELTKSGDQASAHRVLEFAYARDLEASNFSASNFLGFAEVRLQQGNATEAMALLRRMQLVSGEPFENLLPAARLLDKFGKRAEALEFANKRVEAVPWDREARELQARLKSPPQSAPPPSDYRVLLRAIAAAPDDNSLRLPLFRSLLSAARPQLAISALMPLFDEGGLKWNLQQATDLNRRTEEPMEDVSERTWLSQQFLSRIGLADDERATVAAQAAGAYESLNEYSAAALLLGIAQQLRPSPALEKQWNALNTRVALEKENERRRPIVTDEVEQSRTVRPRLSALPGGAL